MEKVIINLECSSQAASILMPLLKTAQMLGDLGMGNYCAFYVDGENFKVTKLESQPSEVVERVVLKAAAGFAYKMDGMLYKRFPDDEICLVDFVETKTKIIETVNGLPVIETAGPEKPWAFCNKRLDMESTL